MLKTILKTSIILLPLFFFNFTHAAVIQKQPNNLGLVGYWPLNEGVGTQAGDFSGYKNTGTLTGGTWTTGKRGNALSFNGTSDKVVGGNITVGINMTISAWIKKNASTAEEPFLATVVAGRFILD